MIRRRQHRRGMTLIEVLIVVVILLALMSAVGFGVIRLFHETSSEVATTVSQRALAVQASDERPAPIIEEASLEVALDAQPVLDGLRVGTEYRSVFEGRYTLRNPDPVPRPLQLVFPFPDGTAQVHGVSFLLSDGEGPAYSPPEARYSSDGIAWSGSIAPQGRLEVSVRYSTTGKDRLELELPRGSHPMDLHAVLTLPAGVDARVDPQGLAPTAQDGGQLSWHIEGVVSPRPIAVSLPAGRTPAGRLSLATQLSALGLLLFSAGFWYASEGARPGRLDDFRLGGLLLLALTYSVFYALFAVVGHVLGPMMGLVAALASLPLLGLHVAGLTDRRFALTRALPLAAISHAAVLGAVYLDGARLWLALGLVIAATAWVTLTWRSWTAARALHAVARAEQEERAWWSAEIERARKQLEQAIAARSVGLPGTLARVEGIMEGSPPLRARVERATQELERDLAYARQLCEGSSLDEPTLGAHPQVERWAAHRSELQRVRGALDLAAETLEQAVSALEQSARGQIEERIEAQRRLEQQLQELALAGAEAAELARQARTERRQEIEVELARTSALQEEWRRLCSRPKPAAEAELRQLLGTAAALHQRLKERSSQLVQALRVDREVTALHCPGCGAAHVAGGRFCPSCGLVKPVEIVCGACSAVSRFPSHLLRAGWQEHLHCCGCGAPLPGPSPVCRSDAA